MNARILLGVLIGVGMLAGSPRAQTLVAATPNPHHLGLSAMVAANGGAAKSKGNVKVDPGGKPMGGNLVSAEQQHFSNVRQSEDELSLDVDIRNLARTPDAVKLEWFFFARSLKGGEPHLFDSGSQDVKVPPTDSIKIDLHSKELVAKVEKKLYLTDGVDRAGNPIAPQSSVNRTGEKPVGWAVRLTDSGNIVEFCASSPTFETLGRAAVVPPPESASGKKKK